MVEDVRDIMHEATWNGRIFPVALSNATASQSNTTDSTSSFTTAGMLAAMSGYFPVLFSLFRLQRHAILDHDPPCTVRTVLTDKVVGDNLKVVARAHLYMYTLLPSFTK
jgi:hypothetical protein